MGEDFHFSVRGIVGEGKGREANRRGGRCKVLISGIVLLFFLSICQFIECLIEYLIKI